MSPEVLIKRAGGNKNTPLDNLQLPTKRLTDTHANCFEPAWVSLFIIIAKISFLFDKNKQYQKKSRKLLSDI